MVDLLRLKLQQRRQLPLPFLAGPFQLEGRRLSLLAPSLHVQASVSPALFPSQIPPLFGALLAYVPPRLWRELQLLPELCCHWAVP